MLTEEFSMIGFLDNSSAGIIGLYVAILITVGGVIRKFLLPKVSELMFVSYDDIKRRYTNIPDPSLLLSLIHSLYVCRYGNYK